jgi:hypothetical protein
MLCLGSRDLNLTAFSVKLSSLEPLLKTVLSKKTEVGHYK